ncbi:holo-ACP synthase [Aquabacterium lacunae]|uniref:Holo-[acyl-carrier-protein] synthase n=1 Tax=Aquabacterium lacunae TaxID=2528630 RepID=A0A4Q9H4T9_9BURK|nr:holo-ACP synthase [Aquabacterium lacunae]TBO32500.1 holo-ACP synthase [Aquabacterium lacunae]
MIVGIGTDLCDIRRIQQTLDRKTLRFAEKVLGPNELLVFQQRLAKVPARGVRYLATRFAAKEAFSKAIGLGMRMPMTWRRCEILNAPSGRPEIRLHDELADWFAQHQWKAHVTVTDEVDHALAFVVVETL